PFALLEVCATQIVVSGRPIRRQFRHLAECVYSLFTLPKLGASQSQPVEVEPEIWIDLGGLLEGPDGIFAAGFQVDLPQSPVALVRAWRQLQSQFGLGDGLLGLAGVQINRSQRPMDFWNAGIELLGLQSGAQSLLGPGILLREVIKGHAGI